MSSRSKSVLLLALGNDIMGDDAVALVAARILEKQFASDVDFVVSSEGGLSLLEILSGYDQVLLLDSIVTGKHRPGTVLEFSRGDFDKALGSSPHYAGLPEVLGIARQLNIDFPEQIRVLAIEIETPYDFRETLTEVIEQAIPDYVEKAGQILHQWKEESARNITNSKPVGKYSQRD